MSSLTQIGLIQLYYHTHKKREVISSNPNITHKKDLKSPSHILLVSVIYLCRQPEVIARRGKPLCNRKK